MYNEKDWEKNREPLNGENDVDITEGSYVDGVHTGRSEDRSAGRRMYGQIRRPSEENTGCGTYQYGSSQSQEGRNGRRRRTAGTRKTAATLTEAERKEAGWLRKRPGSRPPDCCLAAWQAEPWRESIT